MENQEIFAIDYQRTKKMSGVMTDDVELIMVEVLSGDEVLRILLKDGSIVHFDSCPGGRLVGYEDGEYLVYPNQFEKWLKRTSSYAAWDFDDEGDDADDN